MVHQHQGLVLPGAGISGNFALKAALLNQPARG